MTAIRIVKCCRESFGNGANASAYCRIYLCNQIGLNSDSESKARYLPLTRIKCFCITSRVYNEDCYFLSKRTHISNTLHISTLHAVAIFFTNLQSYSCKHAEVVVFA